MRGQQYPREFPLLTLFSVLIPFPAVFLNLIVVANPLVIEGIIIRDVPPVNQPLDLRIAQVVLGGTEFQVYSYVSLLFSVYAVSWVVGVLEGLLLFRPIFGELLRSHEVTVASWSFNIRQLTDATGALLFMALAFDHVLAFFLAYPMPLGPIVFASSMSGFILSGFLAGSATAKCQYFVRLFLKSRWEKLNIKSIYVTPRMIRWALVKRTNG